MRRVQKVVLVLFSAAALAGIAATVGGIVAVNVARSEMRGPDYLWGEQLAVASSALGQTVTLEVRTPAGHDPANGPLPVLWVSDGPDQAGVHMTTVESMSRLGLMPPMIVVSVPESEAGRQSDFVPPAPGQENGATRFLAFLRDEARPALEAHMQVDSTHAFVGFSLGGLFAAWAMAEEPDLFDGWIILSPSWWYRDVMIRTPMEGLLASDSEGGVFAFATMGSAEGSGMSGPFDQINALAEASAPPWLTWSAEYTSGADHGSNPRLSSARALAAFWEWRGFD